MALAIVDRPSPGVNNYIRHSSPSALPLSQDFAQTGRVGPKDRPTNGVNLQVLLLPPLYTLP